MGPSVVEALEKEARYFMSSGLAMTVDICIPLLFGGWGEAPICTSGGWGERGTRTQFHSWSGLGAVCQR